MLLRNSDKTTDHVAEQLRNDFASGLRSCIPGNRKGTSGDSKTQGESSCCVEAHGESVNGLEAQVMGKML